LRFGIDLDHTITAAPALFAWLAQAIQAAGGEVHILTGDKGVASPSDADYAQKASVLTALGISYDALYVAPHPIAAHKAEYCKTVGINWFVDDRYRNVIEVSQICPTALFTTPDSDPDADNDQA
jgi:uncharacterized HAD superfamily protein